MTISERIFEMLKERRLSQKEFAERTGIAQSTISDWKNKKTNPASDKIMVICDILEITLYELLLGTDDSKFRQVERIVINKDSKEYQILLEFEKLDKDAKQRALGYVQALSEKS